MSDQSKIPSWSFRRKMPMRSKLLFSGLGSFLLLVMAVAMIIPQFLDQQQAYAHGGNGNGQGRGNNPGNGPRGFAQLKLDTNAKTLTVNAKVSGAPANTPLVMHVHGGGSCTGPILFMMDNVTSDGSGNASVSTTFSKDKDGNALPSSIPTDWFFNVHNATQINPTDNKPVSIACGPVQGGKSASTAHARLSAVPLTVTPVPAPASSTSSASTTTGTATIQLDTDAHTLAIQAHITGAPANTPLVMHIHGGGSCTGPILYAVSSVTSDASGNATVAQTFTQDANGSPPPTSMPSDWFFNVHNTTQINPADNKPVSIACGPIQVADPDKTQGNAQLAPAQPSSPMPPMPGMPGMPGMPMTSLGTPSTSNGTQGLAIFYLNPSSQSLNILANISGAPASTPLVMHIHSGSCKGPILYMLSITNSDSTGHAFVVANFTKDNNGNALPTSVPSDWFFNVHDTTKPSPDDPSKPLSIACGPVQQFQQTSGIGTAQLSPA